MLTVGEVAQRLGCNPDRRGTTVSLRVPGGTLDNGTDTVSGMPEVSVGGDYYAWVRDQGVIAGGNTDSVIFATVTADLHEVNDGIVYGPEYAEPIAQFEAHFVRQVSP